MEMNYNIRVGKAMFMIVLYIYVILSVSPALAQTGVSKGLDSIGAIYNIKYEIPKDFNDLDTVQLWAPVNDDGKFGWIYWVFESKDKQCKVLYRLLPSDVDIITYRIDNGLRNIFGTEDNLRDKHLRTFTQKETWKSFNADSVFLYNVPTAEPKRCDEKFIYCVQMLIFRQNRSILELVWYFTDKGKKKEKRYMRKINKRIWFNDGKEEHCGQIKAGEDWIRNYLKERCVDWNVRK